MRDNFSLNAPHCYDPDPRPVSLRLWAVVTLLCIAVILGAGVLALVFSGPTP
jgi:hypothetical protein